MDFLALSESVFTEFESDFLAEVGTDSAELIEISKGYLSDSKQTLLDIGEGCLKGISSDPAVRAEGLSWAEGKLKLAQEGNILKAAFISAEQILASDIQSFANKMIAKFETILTNILLSLNPA